MAIGIYTLLASVLTILCGVALGQAWVAEAVVGCTLPSTIPCLAGVLAAEDTIHGHPREHDMIQSGPADRRLDKDQDQDQGAGLLADAAAEALAALAVTSFRRAAREGRKLLTERPK